MGFDLLALLVLLACAAFGARRGALASGLSLAGLVVGYGISIVAGRWLAAPVAASLGVPTLLGGVIAGTAAFVFVSIDAAVLSWVLRRRAGAPSRASRIGGALFGALRGALVVLLIGVLALWLDAWRAITGAAPEAPSAAATPLREATRTAIEAGVETALGHGTPEAAVTAHLLARPAESLEQLQSLAASPEIAALAADQGFWTDVESGDVGAALSQPSFVHLQWSGARRRELAALGVVDPAAAADPGLFALAARDALEQLGPRLRALREDPDLAALARDPAVADLVARHDLLGLLAHPGFQRVLAHALDAEPPRG
jgi:hypothetical protein